MSEPAHGRRWRIRWLLVGLGVLAIAWAAVVGARVWSAYGHDRQGLAALDEVRSRTDPTTLTTGSTARALGSAAAQFAAARRDLSGPLVAPVAVVPVFGRQVRSARALSAAAQQVATIGSSFLAEVHDVLDQPHGAGPQRVASLRHLSALSAATAQRLGTIDAGPSTALVGPLADRHAAFERQLGEARDRLTRAAGVTKVVADILQGPQTYLVLAANNAEMRAGSGDFLDVGVATAQDGTVHLDDLGPSGQRPLPVGLVTATGDLARNWGWLQPGVDWRNLGVTPEFDVTAPLAARMWEASTGQHVDGVLALDVAGLRQILSATGPVVVGGRTVGADDVEQYLLHDQYDGLTDSATADAGRQDALGGLASAVLRELQGQSTDLRSLGRALSGAVAGRHLLVWSSDPAMEAVWKASGVSGRLTGDSLAVTLINRGANKLDQYVTTDVTVSVRPSGTGTEVTLTTRLDNTTPGGQSEYLAGPYPGLGLTYGDWSGLFAVNLPAAARQRSLSGAGPLAIEGAEGPTWLLAAPLLLHQGGQATVVTRFRLPGRHGTMTVVPSARVPAETWHLDGGTTTDEAPRTISW